MALSDFLAQAPSMIGIVLVVLAFLYFVGATIVGLVRRSQGETTPIPEDHGFPQL